MTEEVYTPRETIESLVKKLCGKLPEDVTIIDSAINDIDEYYVYIDSSEPGILNKVEFDTEYAEQILDLVGIKDKELIKIVVESLKAYGPIKLTQR